MIKYTKQAICNTFLKELEEKSLDKITIKDLIEKTEINRNTFYYYFRDIYDLLENIFQEEVQKFIEETMEESTFYEEYTRAAKIILERRKSIIHIYRSKCQEVLKRYLQEVTERFVRKFVLKAAADRPLTENAIKYITYFYSYSIVGNTLHWIEDGLPDYREDLIKLISRSFNATIDDMVKDVFTAQTQTEKIHLNYK